MGSSITNHSCEQTVAFRHQSLRSTHVFSTSICPLAAHPDSRESPSLRGEVQETTDATSRSGCRKFDSHKSKQMHLHATPTTVKGLNRFYKKKYCRNSFAFVTVPTSSFFHREGQPSLNFSDTDGTDLRHCDTHEYEIPCNSKCLAIAHSRFVAQHNSDE